MGRVIALDGHDGAGKTTLARALAERTGGRYVRPFAGAVGTSLLQAHENDDPPRILQIGASALDAALAQADGAGLLVLDRSWITVGTLVPHELFVRQWRLWIPTVLLWCDLDTTVARLSRRSDEPAESREYHRQYLDLYLERRLLCPGPALRTDTLSETACLNQLLDVVAALDAAAPRQ